MEYGLTVELVQNIEALGLVREELGHSYTMWVSKGNNPLGAVAVFKCKDVTPSELFGYNLARVLELPVPRFQGVWFDRDMILPDERTTIRAGQMAILSEFLCLQEQISPKQLSQEDKSVAAKYLLILLFGRHEPVQVHRYSNTYVFLDLECIGPALLVNESEEYLRDQCDGYLIDTDSQFKQVIDLARALGLQDEFVGVFRAAQNAIPRKRDCWVHGTGHPDVEGLSAMFMATIHRRLEACSLMINLMKRPEGGHR